MNQHILTRDGARLRGFDCGDGPAVVFQHGLGGDEAQVAEIFPPQGLRRLTLECRAQGGSEAGDPQQFSIAQFADDVLAYADARGIERFVAGGISMGAAIALRIAVIAPHRVSALVLARPTWTWTSAPENMKVFSELAGYLARSDRAGFEASATARHFAIHAPDNLASHRKFFDRADPVVAAQLLSCIAASGPEITEFQVRSIGVPTLIVANGIDLVHPVALARGLAQAIAMSHFVEVTPKATDRDKHAAEMRAAILAFLQHQGRQP